MNRRFPGTLIVLLIFPVILQAQVRTWVSGTGQDTNPCTRVAPCRTFGAAISAVALGGEVVVLDSAGYGPVIVSKGVSLISPDGIHAAIAPTTGSAIAIGTTDPVTVRNLFLNGQGALTGVEVIGGLVTLEDCTVDGFQETGIHVTGQLLSQILITDTLVRNGNQNGIALEASSGTITATLRRVEVHLNYNGVGISILDNVRATITDSISSRNQYQIVVTAQLGNAEVDIQDTVMSGLGSMLAPSTGLLVGADTSRIAVARVSNCLITANGVGVQTIGAGTAQILSRTNNTLEGNTGGNTFPGPGYLAK